MSRLRNYLIAVGDDPDTAAPLTSPGGGTLWWQDRELAMACARKVVEDGKHANAFVMKLAPTAMYMGIQANGTTYADETLFDAPDEADEAKAPN